MNILKSCFNYTPSYFIIASLCLIAIGCKPDISKRQWDVDVLTPILNSQIDIKDMVSDSILKTSDDGALSLIYRSKIADFQFDAIQKPFNVDFINTLKLSTIDLDRRDLIQSVSLGQLALKAGIVGAFVIANNGTVGDMPDILGVGPEVFQIDASQYFKTLTLKDGWFIVKISNQLPVAISNLQYAIENKSGGLPIIQKTVANIPAMSVYKDSVQLNNITIEGEIKATLTYFDVLAATNVYVDTSNIIQVEVSLRDLEPTSATAIFSDQILLEDTTDTKLVGLNGSFTEMYIREGSLYLDALSTVEDALTLQYKIPSAKLSGSSLNFTEIVPPALGGGSSQKYTEKSLAQYAVDLTGRPSYTNVYNEFYTQTSARIDSSGNLITLALNDSVILKTGFKNLIPERAYGYLGIDTFSSINTSKTDIFKELKADALDFKDVIFTLDIENYIGAPLTTNITHISAVNAQNAETQLNWTLLHSDLNITAAIENTPSQKPTPSYSQYILDNSNSNIDELLESQLIAFNSEITTYTNKNGSIDYNQFIYADYGIKAYASIEIPLHLAAKNIFFKDSVAFSYTDIDPSDRLQSGELILIGNSTFPFDFNLDIILLDKSQATISTLQTADQIKAAPTNSSGIVSESLKSNVSYPLTPEIIENLKQTHYMVFVARFSSPNFPDKVKLYKENNLFLTLSGDFKLRTGK